MVDLGYYSNRLDELEQRKAEVAGKLVSAKLSLKGINNEIEACKEAMNNLTSPVDTEKSIREIKFFQQSEKITELKQDIARLKDWNDYLKNHCKDLEHELDIKSHEL